jgi:hypothetical protein
VKELFPLVTGRVQWLKALQEINIGPSIDYLALNEFCVKAIAIRNLLHQGMRLTSPWNMSEECVRQVKPMLSMFVALHNKYIVPFKYSLS